MHLFKCLWNLSTYRYHPSLARQSGGWRYRQCPKIPVTSWGQVKSPLEAKVALLIDFWLISVTWGFWLRSIAPVFSAFVPNQIRLTTKCFPLKPAKSLETIWHRFNSTDFNITPRIYIDCKSILLKSSKRLKMVSAYYRFLVQNRWKFGCETSSLTNHFRGTPLAEVARKPLAVFIPFPAVHTAYKPPSSWSITYHEAQCISIGRSADSVRAPTWTTKLMAEGATPSKYSFDGVRR